MMPWLALHKHRSRVLILTDQAVVSGSNFMVGVLLARALGLEGYGIFTMAWFVVLMASSVHQAIMVAPLYALLPRSEDAATHLSAVLRAQVRITFGLFLVLALVLHLCIAEFTGSSAALLPWSLAGATASFLHQDMLRRVLFAQRRPARALLLDMIAYGLQLPLLFQVDVKDASTALLVIAITLALPSAWMHVRLVKELPGVGDVGQLFRSHWSNGRALVLTAVLQWSSGNLFLLAAGGILGASAMGALRMAQNLLGVLNVLFLALENSVPLNAARVLQEQGTRALAGYMGSALKRAAIPTLAVIAVLILFPGPLMGLVYGPEQHEHAWLLSAFAGSYLFVFLGTFLRFALRTLDRNRAILLGYIVTSVFSLVTAKALVGHLGLPGVMIGLFSVQLINLLIYARSVRELWPWNK